MLKIQIYSLFFSATYAFVYFVVIFVEHISPIFLKTRVIKGHKRAEGFLRNFLSLVIARLDTSRGNLLPSTAPSKHRALQAQ
jgi:hypothetical protein